jgi:hypothetical protein
MGEVVILSGRRCGKTARLASQLPPLLAFGRDAGSIAGSYAAKAGLIAFAKTGGPIVEMPCDSSPV